MESIKSHIEGNPAIMDQAMEMIRELTPDIINMIVVNTLDEISGKTEGLEIFKGAGPKGRIKLK